MNEIENIVPDVYCPEGGIKMTKYKKQLRYDIHTGHS
jgi:hypothetical protein